MASHILECHLPLCQLARKDRWRFSSSVSLKQVCFGSTSSVQDRLCHKDQFLAGLWGCLTLLLLITSTLTHSLSPVLSWTRLLRNRSSHYSIQPPNEHPFISNGLVESRRTLSCPSRKKEPAARTAYVYHSLVVRDPPCRSQDQLLLPAGGSGAVREW